VKSYEICGKNISAKAKSEFFFSLNGLKPISMDRSMEFSMILVAIKKIIIKNQTQKSVQFVGNKN